VATRAASPVAGPAASPSPAAARAASGTTRLALAPDASEVRYTVREQLAGRSLPSDAVGTTRSVSGAIVLDPSGAPVADQSRISADLRTLQSDEARRDRYIRENTLEVDRFPTAVFVTRQVQGLPSPLPTSGEASFQLLGDLTIHGMTRPATWEATARFGEQEVTGQATTRLKITDFGMQIPRVTLVLSVEDDVRLDLNFRAAREAA
jgi:polyisoprenoid-binding protein YceI